MELYNLEFSAEAVREAAAAGRLLSMEIEFSRRCNFRCVYCYVENRVAGQNELSPEESRDVIVQARELGARKIIILGGEPDQNHAHRAKGCSALPSRPQGGR